MWELWRRPILRTWPAWRSARARPRPGRACLSRLSFPFSSLACRTSCRSYTCLLGTGCRRCSWASRTCGWRGACSTSIAGCSGADGLARFERRAPRALLEYLELAYLLCYAVVPAGYACLVLAGHDAEGNRPFWSVVLLAAFTCYGLLPWLPTRAPRAIEPSRGAIRSSIRRLNLAVLNRASVQWNTFPSGHTAASLATALAVGSYMPLAGVVLGVVAIEHRRRQRRRPLSLCGRRDGGSRGRDSCLCYWPSAARGL